MHDRHNPFHVRSGLTDREIRARQKAARVAWLNSISKAQRGRKR